MTSLKYFKVPTVPFVEFLEPLWETLEKCSHTSAIKPEGPRTFIFALGLFVAAAETSVSMETVV